MVHLRRDRDRGGPDRLDLSGFQLLLLLGARRVAATHLVGRIHANVMSIGSEFEDTCMEPIRAEDTGTAVGPVASCSSSGCNGKELH